MNYFRRVGKIMTTVFPASFGKAKQGKAARAAFYIPVVYVMYFVLIKLPIMLLVLLVALVVAAFQREAS